MKRRVEGERIGLKVGGNTLKMKKQQRKKGTENEERKKANTQFKGQYKLENALCYEQP